MIHQNILGIDLGGTKVSAGLVTGHQLSTITSRKINALGDEQQVLSELFSIIDELMNSSVTSIGIGVPGLVEETGGIVFDVVNIPSWKEIHLKKWMENRYHVPVKINNDANCFALGEYYFGKGHRLQFHGWTHDRNRFGIGAYS